MIDKKIKSLILLLVLTFTVPFSALSAEYEPSFDVTAEGIYLVNTDTNQVVYAKNEDEQLHPASTTKIMSTALALEMTEDLNVMVTAPDDLWDEFSQISGISNAGIDAGETMSMYDLLHCMMIVSANEAASIVSEYYGGDEFINLMNQKALELGCTGTNFSNPHGLFVDNHYSTAEDLYKITEWALTVPGFIEIAEKSRYTVPATNMSDERLLATTVLVQDSSTQYYTSYIKGVKTGTLPAAGRCLVTTASKDGQNYILTLLGATTDPSYQLWGDGAISSFTETMMLYDWAYDNFETINVINTDTAIGSAQLRHSSQKDELVLYGSGEVSTVVEIAREQDPEITYEMDIPDLVYAPVEFGQEIGKAKVFADGEYIGEISLISRENIEKSAWAAFLDTLSEIMSSSYMQIVVIVVLAIVGIYILYIFVVIISERNKKKKRIAALRRRQQLENLKRQGKLPNQNGNNMYNRPPENPYADNPRNKRR